MTGTTGENGCDIRLPDGARCSEPVGPGAPLQLCAHHLLIAHEWVSRETGTTDLLPHPCAACGSRLGVRYPSGWLCAVCEWRHGEFPADDARPPRVDVVYYLWFGDRIKIGTSASPRRRFAQLRYDEVLAFERGGRALEQSRHARFGAHRLPGTEWFQSHPALTEHVRLVSADGTIDPWERLALWRSQESALHS